MKVRQPGVRIVQGNCAAWGANAPGGLVPLREDEELKQQAEYKTREVAPKQLSRVALSFFVGRMALTMRRVPLA
ncbi:hypothetical protein [Pseudomonas sp. S3E17]|uniref:hypothetical protein n=1 Tax=Pseudomonas sp. S3E17 TaxID=2817893 RepID=UPI0020A1FC30|nr:hypothetical protein [Pseudomonas sp. S3E17]MCP1462267.1 hypothetical protein [Pseudomonas sp. S3E17]